MGIIERYVFREWLQSFLLTLGVVIGLLILQNMYDTLPDLLNQSASWGDIVLYYAWALPMYFPATLPIVLLVSVLLSLGSLHRNNEIVAMRVSGIHLLKISRSLLGIGLVSSLVMLCFTAYLVPISVENSRTLFENVKYTAAEQRAQTPDTIGLIYNLAYSNSRDYRLWFMNRFNERSWQGSGVSVHIRNSAGKELKGFPLEKPIMTTCKIIGSSYKAANYCSIPKLEIHCGRAHFRKSVFCNLMKIPA